ncbi:hypothetical protein EG68_06450 [Paragonimus skrjabini miyazakii]|uniref:Transcription factor TFIIIC triple barrel domain-containing protein n=1 Tax=Paragonimus skrjabini miyazakii TaxID=59628 RepID=A0A8S9YZD7_9TREM|nr:hypothetical protein EG68_06450 [Paragonimus skrjabini miyazakii]
MSNNLVMTTLLLDGTQLKVFAEGLQYPRSGLLDVPDWQPWSTFVHIGNTITKILSIPRWMFGRFLTSFVTEKAPVMCTKDWNCGPKDNYVSAVSASFLLYGEMTRRVDVSCTLSRASTAIQPTEVETVPVLSVCACLIDQKKRAGRESLTLWPIDFWISDSWDDGGLCTKACKITTSMTMNGHHSPVCWLSPLNLVPPCVQTEAMDADTKTDSEQFTSGGPHSTEQVDGSSVKPVNLAPLTDNELQTADCDVVDFDSDSWELMDEEVLYADCQNVIESDVLHPNNPIRFVDMDTSKPLVQIGPAVFEGQYDNALGTLIFLDSKLTALKNRTFDQTESRVSSPLAPPSTTRNPVPNVPIIKSFKRLNLNRVFMKPHSASDRGFNT